MELLTRIKKSDASLYLVVSGMWILFLHEALKSFAINVMPVAYSGYFILFFALLIELMNRALSFLDRKYRYWILSIWIFSVFALIYGIVKSYELQFLSRDIWPYSFFACFLLAARTTRWNTIDKMIYQQFLIGLGVFIYIGLTLDIPFQRHAIELNTGSWNVPRIYWAWGLLYGWQYLFLTYNNDMPLHRKMSTFLGITLFIAFGIIMLKRQMIVEIGIIGIFKLIYMVKVENANVIKLTVLLLAIAIVGLSIVRFYEKRENVEYINLIASRFTESGSMVETVLQNTRLLDTPQNIYNQASVFEIAYGQGLGSAVEKDGIVDTVVESGFFTIFMKGGIIYLMIWYFGFLSILKDVVLRMRRRKLLYGLLSAMFIISSPMSPFFIPYPASGYQMFWLGQCASRMKI
jgi:hypothetical protein